MSSKDAINAMVAARMEKKKAADREEAEQQAKAKQEQKSKRRTDDDEEILEDADEGEAEEAYQEEDEEEHGEGAAGDDDADMLVEESKEDRNEVTKPRQSVSDYLTTELEADESEWNTERDEAAEAEAHASALNGSSKKKRRLVKLADANQQLSLNRHTEDDDDGFIVDDVGGFDKDDDFGVKRDKKLMESIQLQKPFQPAATTQEQGNRRRFLAFNAVGSIATTEMNSEHTSGVIVHTVEIAYSDSSKHKNAKFRDFFNFKVAALGAHGAVFASETGWDKQDKKEIPSTLFFRPTETWDAQASSEWQLQMDLTAKEEAELVAIGDTWVSVATNKQYVRVISHSGVQKFILSLNGPVVTMVGHGNVLAVVYHDGIPLPGHQNLGLVVMDIVKKKEVYRGKCVISPRSKLTWLGYSDIGMLLGMDSFGVIRALARAWDWQWSPILDTNLLKKPGSTDSYWPVSLIDDKLMCVLLKNGARFPSVQPRPTLQAVSMQLPFLDLLNDNRVALAEENHARCELLWYNDDLGGMATASKFFTSKQETIQDKTILGLFQKACALDRHTRALDLCTMLHKKKAVEIAIQIATHAKKTALVNRLTMLLQVKFPAVTATSNRRDDDEGLSSFLDAPAAAAPSKRGLLRRPAVSFEDAEEENKRGNDDGEVELEFGSTQPKSSLKRKFEDSSTLSATPLASLTSSLNVNGKTFASANVKPKTAPSTTQSSTPIATNPFARKP